MNITKPTNSAAFTAPATIALEADATDTDGTISLVEFFNGNEQLGQTTTFPYSFTWTNVGAGTYTLTARATDNLGATTTSTPVAVSVTNSMPASPVIQNPLVSDGAFRFSFATTAGQNYLVQFTDSLDPTNWQLTTNFTGSGAVASVTNAISAAERFYRVRVQ